MHPVFQMVLQGRCRKFDVDWRVFAKKKSYSVKSDYMEFSTMGTMYVNNKMLGESRNSLFHGKDDVLYVFCKQFFFIYLM